MFDIVIYIALGIIVCAIGAIPLGLVNLSVIKTSLERGLVPAMNIAYGATFVELIYGLSALFFGSVIQAYLWANTWPKYIVVIILLVVSVIFWLRKEDSNLNLNNKGKGIVLGAGLNILSFQVLLYWLMAVAFLASRQINFSVAFIASFIAGVGIGKLGVLYLYSIFSSRFIRNIRFITKHINKIIAIVLVLAGLYQITHIILKP